jgi:uncharacterized protein YegL
MGWASYREDIVSRFVGSSVGPSSAPRSGNATTGASVANSRAASVKFRRNGGEKMSRLKEFTVSAARPLPVIVLADVSGSMETDGKIQALNLAVREMLDSFKDESDLRAEIHVSVITFGGQASTHLPLGPAKNATWTDLGASGGTPMGAAFDLARQLVEDRNAVPGRALRPTIVLASDGQPTDAWEQPLKALLDSERGGKGFRMALAIGGDADHSVLQAFLADPEARVFRADEARQIRQFFRLVTMSVSSRSRSANPNSAPATVSDDGWDL